MKNTPGERREDTDAPRHHVRLPQFITEDDIGLGDVIKRATSVVGIKPCGGCLQRAARLNAWVGFSGRRPAR